MTDSDIPLGHEPDVTSVLNEILLIEDNADDAKSIMKVLTERRIAAKVARVADGSAALDYIFGTGASTGRNAKEVPRLIILDLRLPKMTGFEFLRTIRSYSQFKEIPIVIFSGSEDLGDIARSYDLGANSYVVKPFELDKFFDLTSEVGRYWLQINRAVRS